MPPIGDAVPAKQVSITSWPRPSTSKICAPQYEERVEIPIFERILSRPFSAARGSRSAASAGVGPRLGRLLSSVAASLLAEDVPSTLASASHGCTASAP